MRFLAIFAAIAAIGCGVQGGVLRVKRQADAEDGVKIGVLLQAPLVQKDADGGYEGFLVEILDQLLPGTNLSMQEYADEAALLTALEEGSVTVGAGPITISFAKESQVDFTKPVLSGGVAAVVARPQPAASSNRMFAYFRPLTGGVWVVFLLCTVLAGVLLYLNNRYHPKEAGSGPKAPSIGGEGRRLADAFWWIMRSFALQGAESRPKSIAGRIVCIVWIMFLLDSLFIYLAALIHNVPVYYGKQAGVGVTPPLPFASVDELYEQSQYTYGAVRDSTAHTFFSSSNAALFKKINERLQSVDSLDAGLDKVRSEDFVLFTDSQLVDYYTAQDCDLVRRIMVSSSGYGFALQTGDALRDQLSAKLLRLKEDGEIQLLANKWFPTASCPDLQETSASSSAAPEEIKIGMDSYGGPVLLLILGFLVALLVAVVEVMVVRQQTQSYVVADEKAAADPEKQPMLDAEEGQAVQYNDNGAHKAETDSIKKEDEVKEDIISAESANDVKSAPSPVVEEAEKDITDNKTDDKKEKSEEKTPLLDDENPVAVDDEPAAEEKPSEEDGVETQPPEDKKPEVPEEETATEEVAEEKQAAEDETNAAPDTEEEKKEEPEVTDVKEPEQPANEDAEQPKNEEKKDEKEKKDEGNDNADNESKDKETEKKKDEETKENLDELKIEEDDQNKSSSS